MDYSNTIIYRLKCKTDAYTDVFVDHTTNLTKRRYNYKHLNGKGEIYDAIKQSGGFENWEMTVLEHYTECDSKLAALIRVFEWIEKIKKEESQSELQPCVDPPTNARTPAEIRQDTRQETPYFTDKRVHSPPRPAKTRQNSGQKGTNSGQKGTFPAKTRQDPSEPDGVPDKRVHIPSEVFPIGIVEPAQPTTDKKAREQEDISKLQCRYCGAIFKRQDNVTRHVNKNRCKQMSEELDKMSAEEQRIQELEEMEEKLKKEMEREFAEEMREYKKRLETYINKHCKIHPKTLTKINNTIQQQNNLHNQNINSHNNITNNNNINIVELGKENVVDLFDRDQQMTVLGKRYKCLDYLIESVHFSDKFKQFQNIAITNINNSLAYKYVESEKRFMSVNKDDMLEDIITYRMQDINEFYANCKDDGLDTITSNSVRRFIDDMDNDKRKQEKIKNLRLTIYNLRDKVNRNPDFLRILHNV